MERLSQTGRGYGDGRIGHGALCLLSREEVRDLQASRTARRTPAEDILHVYPSLLAAPNSYA